MPRGKRSDFFAPRRFARAIIASALGFVSLASPDEREHGAASAHFTVIENANQHARPS